MTETLTVLYVAGWGRSGGTLLGNILNEVEGCFFAGELRSLWKKGVLDAAGTCGCGHRLGECPLWAGVLAMEVEPGVTVGSAAEAFVADQRARFRTRHTWRLLRGAPHEPSAAHVRVMAATYRAIGAITGSRVIVDTSKHPSEAAALLYAGGITPKMLHMVRDPRAVAYSWQRPKAYLPPMGALTSTSRWLRFNLAAEAVGRRMKGSSMLLRYEDLVAMPEAWVARVLELIGEPPARSPVRGSGVVLGINHTVAGNPDRHRTGAVEIREDDAWRTGLSARLALEVTAIALPLLRRYGYPLVPKRWWSTSSQDMCGRPQPEVSRAQKRKP